MILPLAVIPPIMKIVAVVWVIVAVVLVLLVLIQKGRGGGLSGAFGGAGGANSLMGTKTGDFLTWVTIGLVVVFLFLAVIMAKYYKPAASTGLEAPPTQPRPVAAPALPQTPAE